MQRRISTVNQSIIQNPLCSFVCRNQNFHYLDAKKNHLYFSNLFKFRFAGLFAEIKT